MDSLLTIQLSARWVDWDHVTLVSCCVSRVRPMRRFLLEVKPIHITRGLQYFSYPWSLCYSDCKFGVVTYHDETKDYSGPFWPHSGGKASQNPNFGTSHSHTKTVEPRLAKFDTLNQQGWNTNTHCPPHSYSPEPKVFTRALYLYYNCSAKFYNICHVDW